MARDEVRPADAADLTVYRINPGAFLLRWEGAGAVDVIAGPRPEAPAARTGVVASTLTGERTVTGLRPDLRWYFTTRPGGSGWASTRQFHLAGAHNVRDLGGFPSSDGRSTRWGRLFRGDGLHGLTAADVEALKVAGVRTVVDFRGAAEVARAGDDRVPGDARSLRFSVLDDTTEALSAAISQALEDGDPETLNSVLGGGRARAISDAGLLGQLSRPLALAAYGRTLALAASVEGALLFHCTAGKDRTGLMAAIMLGVLGVPEDEILADYLASNEYNRRNNDELYGVLADKGVDLELIWPLTEQHPEELLPVFAAIDGEHGGWGRFAVAKLGATEEMLAALRGRMLQ